MGLPAFILSPVNAFYAWYALVTFATATISYFSMKAYSKKSLASFIFSLVYTFAPYRLYLGEAVFGEYLAVTFLPLLFLGIYEVLWGDKKNGTSWLSAGHWLLMPTSSLSF